MRTRLLAIIRKEFLQTFRDIPIVALVIYSFAEIVLCGWAVTMEIRHIPTAVLDRDNSPTSRALLQQFERSSNFHLDFYPANEQGVEGLLDSGQALLGIIIPPGLSRDVATGKPASIQVLVDGTQSNAALLSVGYVNEIVRRYSSEIETTRLSSSGKSMSGLPGIVNNVRAWYLPELRYIHYGMVSMVTLAVVLLGIRLASASIIREKESGTLEQLMVTPITPLELILAKVIPMIVLEIGGLLIGVTLSFFVFGVAPHGNPIATLLLFIALSTLAFLATVGIGIWIATYARNQIQALLLTFFVLFPMMFLSGTITPVSAMPIWLQWLSFLSPMRHYLALALGIFIKGLALNMVWPHALTLAGFTILILWVGLRRFRRSLE
ncbi:MAG TPA: ABC transporter permease [Anaerolineales bacterium]|nr:ABC transporter permease [Anaerolineales bacterium]HLO30525.1 ABC transporter permease [Anaerolineales bacterium]